MTVPTVAAELGFAVKGSAVSPCPACKAEKRHPGRKDHRGAVGLKPGGTGWRCFECDAGGDALDFVAFALAGARLPELPAPRVAEVRAWYASRGWCDAEDATRTNADGQDGTRPGWAMRAPARVRVSPPSAPETEPPHPRPPADEVRELWAACLPVTEDEDVAAWLASRALDAAAVAELDLARALPRDARLPRWAAFRGRSWASGWRCVFPVFGAGGELESLRARLVREPRTFEDGGEEAKASAASAGPGSASGLVLADALALSVLRSGAAPEWWPAGKPFSVLVTEGELDFLTMATKWSEAAEDAPAVFGIWQGSWTPGIAARIPDGARVLVATDADDPNAKTGKPGAGDLYAATIRDTLSPRCNLRRVDVRKLGASR